jgi:hypothetical protein
MIPDFSVIPTVRGRRIEQVVFVTGRVRAGVPTGALFQELAHGARAVPFVFAFDPNRVLFAGLAPAPVSVKSGRASFMDALGRHAESIEVVREQIDSLVPVIDHRYDRLFE